jgi:hypothetical protein
MVIATENPHTDAVVAVNVAMATVTENPRMAVAVASPVVPTEKSNHT